jgi:uncharacterized protein
MSQEVWFWTVATLATFFIGAAKGGLPMVGLLSVPTLSLAVSPVVAAGLTLPLYIISDIYGLWLYRHSYNMRILKIVVPAMALGVLAGWLAATATNDSFVKGMVGTIGLAYTADALVRTRRQLPPKPADVPRGLFWGSIAGFTSFVSHAGGPPYQMYVLPQRLDKMTFAGTSTIAFTIINLIKVPPYWQLGQINLASLQTGLYLIPVALFGAFAGYQLTAKLPEKLFFRIVEIALVLLSLRLLYEAFFRAS